MVNNEQTRTSNQATDQPNDKSQYIKKPQTPRNNPKQPLQTRRTSSKAICDRTNNRSPTLNATSVGATTAEKNKFSLCNFYSLFKKCAAYDFCPAKISFKKKRTCTSAQGRGRFWFGVMRNYP